MRFVPTNVHALLDYVVGLLLIAAPFLFGFFAGGIESWLPIVLGLAVIGLALFTDFELGMVRRITMPTHLAVDGAAGALLLVSPWLFGFADLIAWPHVTVGAASVLLALVTQLEPVSGRTPRNSARVQREANPRRPR